MDGKTRGGKRLAKKETRPLPVGWAVVALVAVALIFTGWLFAEGRNEAQKAAQGGLQDGDGVQVISWTPEGFGALCVPTEPPEDGREAATPWSEDDLVLLAQTIYAEAAICRTTRERAAVVWCVLNRLDAGRYGDSIREVVTAPYQFAWSEDRPVVPAYIELAEDVLRRWAAEKEGREDVGRVLPAGYLFFEGDGRENHFTTTFPVGEADGEWAWTLPDPYGEG